jgi:hypothetical protein|tara:strand:+ start:8294 stop:8494 length:201 start_codon:yes stop_codon:yes gene_type:complete
MQQQIGSGSITDDQVQEQLRVNQHLQKINTLMDVMEGVNSDSYDGVQRLNIVLLIEKKLIQLIEEL